MINFFPLQHGVVMSHRPPKDLGLTMNVMKMKGVAPTASRRKMMSNGKQSALPTTSSSKGSLFELTHVLKPSVYHLREATSTFADRT